jgi:GNAT superfamily N-acetyltransferase
VDCKRRAGREVADLALEIRPAVRQDLDAIIDLILHDSLSGSPPDEQTGATSAQIDAFDTIAAHPDNEIVVATLGGEVIGTLQLTFIPGLSSQGAWRAQVEAVRVRADLRGQGIGARLMEWVIQRARDRGCRLVQLTTNRARLDAHRFYERLGFVASHTGMKLHL